MPGIGLIVSYGTMSFALSFMAVSRLAVLSLGRGGYFHVEAGRIRLEGGQ